MAFFKFRWPGRQQPAGDSAKPSRRASQPRSSQAAPSVEDMRRRARHRLIGAAVLVAAGVVGFPLLFDSQPRPVPVNVAIDIPDRNKVAPLVLPQDAAAGSAARDHRSSAGLVDGEELVPAAPPRSPRPGADAPPATSQAPSEAARAAAAPAPKAEASSAPRPEPKVEPKPPARPEPKPENRPDPKPDPKPESKPEAKPEPKQPPAPTPVRSDDASRARALLEGRNPVPPPAAAPARADSPEAGRFIVQVGAFADADKAREVRDKLERSGLKTYTQVVETKEGSRTRVRVGPFASRAEADRAAERARSAGLPGSVLGL
ncbi:sporulation protein [Melaminivora suipulveris]|uniref:Sporulation protein n=1 Tax=Melaminivora suipulveris TaxID=2109913 RepID=A0A2R3QFG2_9BURK|nr:SPOR domain-containing protein [Melaminivora suipulveris]AVO50490.1 sporulation protein [Melaminivora suipulveris]